MADDQTGAADAASEPVVNERVCPCCGQKARMETLSSHTAREEPAVTSDGEVLDPCTAERLLCHDCGVLCTVTDPADALRRYRTARAAIAPGSGPSMAVTADAGLTARAARQTQVLEACQAAFGGKRKGSILDIGCGDGHFTRRFAYAFQSWQVIGIDASPHLADDWPPASGRPGFIRDAFDPHLFAGRQFDVVIAHDVLNHGPALSELRRIRSIMAPGGLASFDLQLMETAVAAPYVWNYESLFTKTTFEAWLEAVGFKAKRFDDHGRGWHVLAEACEPDDTIVLAAPDDLIEMRALFKDHERWWRRVAIRAERCLAVAQARALSIALFGATVHNGVLCALVPTLRPALIIDDVKAGSRFQGVPVIARSDAMGRELTVLICDPGPQAAEMMAKARDCGLNTIDLTADDWLYRPDQPGGKKDLSLTSA